METAISIIISIICLIGMWSFGYASGLNVGEKRAFKSATEIVSTFLTDILASSKKKEDSEDAGRQA